MCAMIPMLRVSSSLNTLPMVPEPAFFSPVRVATASLTSATYPFTSGNARRPCWLPPCGARLPSSSSLRRANSPRQSAHPRILQQPADRQRLPAERIHFHRNLVVRAAHAPCFHFQQRLHVLDGLLENFQRIVVGLLRHLIHRAVKYALRRRLLAFPHHRADELLHNVAGIDRINRLRPPENESFAWHCSLSLLHQFFKAQSPSAPQPPNLLS